MAKNKLGKFVALGALVGAGAWIYKKYDTIKSMYHKVSIFKGERYEYDEFDGEAIAAMFSGVMIDLSDVEFTEDEVYLDIYALCSGVKILIPSDVEIVLEGTNNASGISVDQDEDTEKIKTLYINYNATASGIHVTDNINEFEDGCCGGDNCCCDDDTCDDDDCSCDENSPSDEKESYEESTIDVSQEPEMVSNVTNSIDESDNKDDDDIKKAAESLDEAARDLHSAIDDFVKDDGFGAFEPVDEEDDFFE